MKKYGLVKLSEEDELFIICSWNENFVNRLVNNATNTVYTKPVKELITGEIIKPNPSVFWDGENTNVKEPKCLTYVTYPKQLSQEEATEYLKILRENPQELNRYLEYISSKKDFLQNHKKR